MGSFVISDRDTVNVYKFMEMCGLKCSVKRNVRVSHKIMLKKLNLRSKSFPGDVVVPRTVNFKEIKKEDISNGKVVFVKDDYEKKMAYFNPNKFDENMFITRMSERERKNIRKQLLKEYKKELEESETVFKEGYIKYLLKKEKREVKEVVEPEEEYVIEKQVRLNRYQRRGFGR